MRQAAQGLLPWALAGLLFAPSITAQTLDQVCPGAVDGTGALFGAVMDADADLVLPGARVVATWSFNGQEQRSEAEVGAEGFYALCLPLETGMTVSASFATQAGPPVELTMTDTFTRLDLSLSMSAGADEERLWMCVGGGDSVVNSQFRRLVRCDDDWQPLELCPKVELGLITVQPVGAGSGMLREMIEQLVQEAKRLGANAVVNVRDGRGGRSFGGAIHLTAITAEGVRIDVDPSTCR